jgi:selenide,water dikinase
MKSPLQSIRQDLVLVGGGHSHAIVLLQWGIQPLPGVNLTLITDQTHAPYSGMLPGHIAGFYDFETCHIDLVSLAKFAGARFCLDRALYLDLSQQKVLCAEYAPIAFDLLSIDIGSTPETTTVPGAATYGIPAKPVPQFLAAWNQLLREVVQNPGRSWQFAIVGGGAGGVELALAMRARLRSLKAKNWQIHLFHRDRSLMPYHNPWIQKKFEQILLKAEIKVHLQQAIQAVTPATVAPVLSPSSPPPLSLCTDAGLVFPCDRLFWVTQASAPAWIQESGLKTDEKGFILVADTLQSLSHPHILAAGDIATMVNYPRPKAGVFAVRQGLPLFQNLRRLCQNQASQPFEPQAEILALIGTGQGKAVASRGRWGWGPSRLLWLWKDWIDRQFMEQFEPARLASLRKGQ